MNSKAKENSEKVFDKGSYKVMRTEIWMSVEDNQYEGFFLIIKCFWDVQLAYIVKSCQCHETNIYTCSADVY